MAKKNKTVEMIKVCGIEPESIVDGPGFRYVLFVQGCSHHCKGCHNPESWATDAGEDMTVDEIFAEIKSNPNLSGVTLSGGEPFEQVEPLLSLAKMIKAEGLHLMSYSGYTLEELEGRGDAATDELLGLLDMLVDGRYIEEQRNLTLIYRGSENQRVIDMNRTREARKAAVANGSEVELYHSDFDIEIEI